MHAIRWVLVALFSMGAPATGLASGDAPVVIVLSWDGTRHDYPERAPTPALDRMAREGVRAARLEPVFPTSTFPNHVSLATGAWAADHGIVANTFRDRAGRRFSYSNDASWIEAEPLWVAAERQGVHAAAFFWVGSETDWNGTGARYRIAPFDGEIPESAKVDQIAAWLDLPGDERPGLIMSWWHGCDAVSHDRGPAAPEVGVQLARQDAQLARLLAVVDEREAWDTTTLFVLSDHGVTEVSRSVDVAGPLRRSGIGVDAVYSGGVAFLFLDDPDQRERALDLLGDVEGVRAYASERLPESLHAYHPGRSGDVAVIVDPPNTVYPPRSAAPRTRGGHGYLPDHPDMGSIFFAKGRGVPADLELGTVRAVDLAATVAHLLAIDPPRDSIGTPIPGIGEGR